MKKNSFLLLLLSILLLTACPQPTDPDPKEEKQPELITVDVTCGMEYLDFYYSLNGITDKQIKEYFGE